MELLHSSTHFSQRRFTLLVESKGSIYSEFLKCSGRVGGVTNLDAKDSARFRKRVCDSCCRGFEPHQPPQYSCGFPDRELAFFIGI
jgi:hypothetical protein